MTSVAWSELWSGLAAGIAAGVVVLVAQWLRQVWYDRFSRRPFRVDPIGPKPDLVGTSRQVRIRVLNRASTPAHINTEPLDQSRLAVSGWRIYEPWGYVEIPNFVPVAAHSWREFWIEGSTVLDAPPPTHVKLFASFITFVPGRTRTYRIDYSRAMGEFPR
jgi:hypothetical protein